MRYPFFQLNALFFSETLQIPGLLAMCHNHYFDTTESWSAQSKQNVNFSFKESRDFMCADISRNRLLV